MHQQSSVHHSPVLPYKVVEHHRHLLARLMRTLRATESFSLRSYGQIFGFAPFD